MRIPDIPDRPHLAAMLGLPMRMLRNYYANADYYYKQFRIQKRSGYGYRIICAPSRELKGIQRWIMAFILRQVELPEVCMAFREGRSILDNASPHVSKEFVFSADIKDFFPSITIDRVVGLFKSLGYPSRVSYALAKLTTCQGRLPQGAPSSPDIANVICRGLDARLSGFCAKRNWEYTRYCDDITISGSGGINTQIAVVNQIIEEEGFQLNPRKTGVVRRSGRQTVTGLVVNECVRIPRHKRKIWRAVFHQASMEPWLFTQRIQELEGFVAFLNMVRPQDPAIPRYRDVISRVKESAN